MTKIELFDHKTDPDENVNVARKPENARLVKKLIRWMEAGYEGARPPKEILKKPQRQRFIRACLFARKKNKSQAPRF